MESIINLHIASLVYSNPVSQQLLVISLGMNMQTANQSECIKITPGHVRSNRSVTIVKYLLVIVVWCGEGVWPQRQVVWLLASLAEGWGGQRLETR